MAHYRKFQNYETLKGDCIRSKNKFKTQKNNKLRWLATNINFNSYTLVLLQTTSDEKVLDKHVPSHNVVVWWCKGCSSHAAFRGGGRCDQISACAVDKNSAINLISQATDFGGFGSRFNSHCGRLQSLPEEPIFVAGAPRSKRWIWRAASDTAARTRGRAPSVMTRISWT